MQIPKVDISAFVANDEAAKPQIAKAVAAACRTNGFFLIEKHGLPDDLLPTAFATARAFFELPLEEKAKCAPPSREVFRGYFGREMRRTAAYREKVEHGDLKEEFLVGAPTPRPPVRLRMPWPEEGPETIDWIEAENIWPAEPAAFRPVFERFYTEMDKLAGVVCRIFAMSLGLPETYFADKTDRHGATANWGYYPPQETPPKPGQIRQGAHTDIGGFTILAADRAPGGLQVQDPDGGWHDVLIPDGALAINLGDLLERWTNRRWKATMHRVVNPPEALRNTARQSMGFFFKPNADAVIACLPTCRDAATPAEFPEILAGEHMLYRMLASRRNMKKATA
ncbi:MAG: isopenicillin N synthase family oxygenase [Telmatospirillum sp.]|nr:isopenicillin N synthase family oxygenase [Telmatospirillum sp.]